MRVLITWISTGHFPNVSFLEGIRGLLAIQSDSVKFGWYIYFYALCIMSYKLVIWLSDKIPMEGFLKIMAVCAIAFILRFGSRILFSRIVDFPDALGVFSHYFQWIPVIISGSIVCKENLFEKWEEILDKLRLKKTFVYLALCAGLYIGKSFFQFGTGVYSNFDSFLMVPFMFGLIGVLKNMSGFAWISQILQKLGGLSMYLWLTHSVLLYEPMQILLCNLRFPIVILAGSFVIMVPIACFLKAFDRKLLQRVIGKLIEA